jgi:HEAT repeat protein
MQRTRRFLVPGLIVVALIFLFAAWRAVPRVPRHAGKTLYQWIEEYDQNTQRLYGGKVEDLDRSEQVLADAQQAIRQIGTNAVPFLIADLRTEFTLKNKAILWVNRPPLFKIPSKTAVERWSRALHGLEVLGPIAKPCLPELVTLATNNVGYGPLALLAVGPDALPAATNLLVRLQHGLTQNLIAGLLNGLHSERIKPEEAEIAVPALLAVVQSPDKRQARHALKALVELRRKPELCVPGLVAALDDSNSDFRRECISALGQFG